MYLIIRWFLNALVLFVVAYIVPGVNFSGTWSLLITAIILGFLNALIRPLIILLTLPINILTLGLFTLVINAIIFWLASTIVKGFEINNFTSAFWGAVIYWVIITLINYISAETSKKK